MPSLKDKAKQYSHAILVCLLAITTVLGGKAHLDLQNALELVDVVCAEVEALEPPESDDNS